MRQTSGPADASGKYNFYCRQCGAVMSAKEPPIQCRWCGNPITDEGFGISGDRGISETSNASNYPSRGNVITNIDKKIK